MVNKEKVDEGIKRVDSKISIDDDESLKKLINFRKRLTSRFEPFFIVEKMRELIENDDRINFYDDRAKKFIDNVRPIFKLKLDLTEELLKEFPSKKIDKFMEESLDKSYVSTETDLNNIIDYKLMVIQYRIFDPFMTILFEELKTLEGEEGNEKLKKEKEEIYRLFPDFKNLERFFLPSIFKVLIDSTKGKLIVIEYVQ